MNDEERSRINRMSAASLESEFGFPDVIVECDGPLPAETGRPTLASDDPAEMAALARCATWRQREKMPGPRPIPGWVHPAECGWCGWPLEELLRACEWSVWRQQRVVRRTLLWRIDGEDVVRAGPTGDYLNPAYASFAALPAEEQRYRVERVVAASRT